MKYLRRYRHLTKVQLLFLCSTLVFSLLCWVVWEAVFSLIGILFELVKGVM